MKLTLFIKIALMTLGQSYDSPNAGDDIAGVKDLNEP